MCNCMHCNSGPDNFGVDEDDLCEVCEGSGEIWNDDEDDYVTCEECGGSGLEDGW